MMNLINLILILILFNFQFIDSLPEENLSEDLCRCPNLTPQIQSRVVNGTYVNPNDLPYVGSIFQVFKYFLKSIFFKEQDFNLNF